MEKLDRIGPTKVEWGVARKLVFKKHDAQKISSMSKKVPCTGRITKKGEK
jgi:hypothetical protein